MRWVSTSGEFAFLSIGGVARGVIAIGGVAHGVVAVGGVASAGVISIGLNAFGTVAAIGLNAVGPICLSAINGLGIVCVAGVNGWGDWTYALVNAVGLVCHGADNSDHTIVPALVVVGLLITLSYVLRGKREPRGKSDVISLASFMRSAELGEARVRAQLGTVREGVVELADQSGVLALQADVFVTRKAREIVETALDAPEVLARVARLEERVPDPAEVSYRERPPETKRVAVSCFHLERAPAADTWLPKSPAEIQWVLAWTVRASAAISLALVLWQLVG